MVGEMVDSEAKPNLGGCPPYYKTPAEMQVKIDAYFIEIDKHNAENPMRPRPYTVTGLARALNLTRQGLINYTQKDDKGFLDSINAARLKVEEFNEEQLYRTGQVTGTIFNLKNNFGWRDAIDQNIGNKDGEAFKTDTTVKANPEQLEALKQWALMKAQDADNGTTV